MREWPRDANEAVRYGELVEPLVQAGRRMFDTTWITDGHDTPYDGFNIGLHERAGCLDADEQLSADSLIYSRDEQGRDPFEEFVGLCVRLGIEQGRRISRDHDGARTEYEISQATDAVVTDAVSKACPEADAGLLAAYVSIGLRDALRDSQDSLTEIHYEREDCQASDNQA